MKFPPKLAALISGTLAAGLLFVGCMAATTGGSSSGEPSSFVDSTTSIAESSAASSTASTPSSTASSSAISAGASSAISGSSSASSSAASSSVAPPASSAPAPPAPTPVPKEPASSAAPESSAPTAPRPNNPAPSPTPRGEYLVGYYASWARGQGFTPLDLDASLLTHINYAFADINSNYQLVLPNGATDRKNLADLRTLKKQNPALKVLISVGGWDYSKQFSNAAATSSGRSTLAQSCVDFILEHGLDGVDLDWEFPVSGGVSGNSNRPADKQNFTKLLREIRNRLDTQSQRDGRPYYLTIAGGADSGFLNKIEPSAVASLVDYIFLMGYDMHGPWDRYADFTAPLYIPEESSPQYSSSVDSAISTYINRGVPASKIVLGMPFYGYSYAVEDPTPDGLFSRFSAAKSISYNKVASSYLNDSSFEQYYNESARVPYLFDGSTFISYEDEDSIAEKVSLANRYRLAGVGAWELSHDPNAVLLSTAARALG